MKHNCKRIEEKKATFLKGTHEEVEVKRNAGDEGRALPLSKIIRVGEEIVQANVSPRKAGVELKCRGKLDMKWS